uniref:ADP-ribosylation factor-related protein 1 n=1 Tax=Ditylenchus dipsaci TaxID=166011 RepID=A0A915DWT1_9BILA
MGRPGLSVDDLQLRLTQDEDWLRDFQEALNRSATLTTSVSSILDDFRRESRAFQREQQNVKKLLRMKCATHLDEYLEKMNNLKEAISFFSSHATYKSQLNHMKQIFETGCGYLEIEFGNQVKSKSISLYPAKILECLDEEFEMPSFRLPNLATIKDTENINKMATWLLANSSSCTQFLGYYSACRSDNMLKTLNAINEHRASRTSKSHFVKFALKKAAGKISEKPSIFNITSEIMDLKRNTNEVIHKDTPITPVLFTLSVLLTLVQLETEACAAVFGNVKVEASILRQVMVHPLSTVLNHNLKLVEAFEGDFETVMPLTKFLMKHTNQIRSLCENIGEGETFARFKATVNHRSVQLISEFVDHLTNDNSRFVPEDGNVHHVTSKTINFLKLLAQNRPVVGYIYEQDAVCSNTFGMGVNLRNKSGTYSDQALGALFMYNNLSYISMCCVRDKSLMSTLNANNDGQLLSFYESEIEEYLKRYLISWTKVTAVFLAYSHSDERKAAKFVYSNFNKEFEKRIKELVLKPYAEFTSRESSQMAELELDRQLKYDADAGYEMFALGRGMYKELIRKEEFFVVLIGLDNAGKTTFVEQFKANFDKTYTKRHPSKISSTVGLNLVKVDCGRALINLWDLGGEEGLRSLWKTYLEECHAIIYLIDASNLQRLEEALDSLDLLTGVEHAVNVPLLVLLNKCDQQETALSDESTSNGCNGLSQERLCYERIRAEITEKFNQIHEGDLAIMSTSALENLNVQKSANWILDAMMTRSMQNGT